MKNIICLLCIFLTTNLYSQTDSLIGPVKAVREKLIFLDSKIQNRKLFNTEDEYGHYGFSSRNHTLSRFKLWWYDTFWSHYSNYFREYNVDKTIKSEIWYDIKDEQFIKYQFKYDSLKHLIQEKITDFDSTFSEINWIYNKYSKLLTSSYSYSSLFPETFGFQYYLYNNDKKLVEMRVFNEDGQSTSTKYEYDLKGRKVKIIHHRPYIWITNPDKSRTQVRDEKGIDYLHQEFIYNDLDQIVEHRFYTEDFYDNNKATLNRKITYQYDKSGRIELENYGRDTITNYKKFNYYKNGLTKTVQHINPKYPEHNRSLEYSYSNRGDIIRLKYIENGKIHNVEFTYKFDSNGNWIEQLKTVNEKPLYLRKREITYY